MGKLTLSRESLEQLIHSDSVDDFTYVDTIFDGEWRWGNTYTLIFKDSADNYWSYSYQEQIGDNYYNSIESEGDTVTVSQVYAVEVKITTYRSTPDGDL